MKSVSLLARVKTTVTKILKKKKKISVSCSCILKQESKNEAQI